ncbi:TonB-dependent receptor domain-containing protein [Melioribacteraceae bacterium 4301-Me]|uniref:TonB-dependent receptor domain-containing protein n=1 Tax=Pyranulibacter aquaticus TaxID=3163344 RepID=UPI003594B276
MKKNILWIVKMMAVYSFWGVILQVIIVNLIFAVAPSGAQDLHDVKISVNAVNITFQQALQIIEKKTNFRFNYIQDEIPLSEKVTVKVEDESLYNVLEALSKEYGLIFNRINNQITIKKATVEDKERIKSLFEGGTIKGKIIDRTGAPVPFANVIIMGTQIGTAANANGEYEIMNVPVGKVTVKVSAVGYKSESQQVTLQTGETKVLDFTLLPDILQLNEIVKTGTRSERPQKETSVSISVLGGELIQVSNASSIADVLAQVPGISAEGGGGEVASNIFVRGVPAGGQYRYQTLQVDGMALRSIGDDGGMSAQDVYFRQDLNIDRVEVVKGGSSALFGFSAPGGIINYISKTGGPTLKTTVKLTTGDKNLYRYDFNSNGPLGETWKFNLGGFYRYDEGPRVSGLPTQGFQFRGNITKLLNNGYMRFYLTLINDRVQFFLPVPFDSKTKQIAIAKDGTLNSDEAADFSFPTPDGTFTSRMSNGVLTKGPTAMFEFYNEFGDGWSFSNKIKLMDVQHEFNIFIPSVASPINSFVKTYLKNPGDQAILSYTKHPGLAVNVPAVIPQGTWARIRPTTDLATQFVLQKKITTESSEHRLSLGSYISRTEYGDKILFTQALFELADRPKLMDLAIKDANGNLTFITRNGVLSAVPNYRNSKIFSNNLSIFAGDEMTINQNLRIDIGFRYEKQSGVVQVENLKSYDLRTANDQSLAISNIQWGSGKFIRRDVQFSDWAGSLGFNYAVNDQFNFYAVGSKSYVFPGLTTFAGNVSLDAQGNFKQPTPDKNETFIQLEGGTKFSFSEFGGSLAIFYLHINDRLQSNLRIIDGQNVLVTEAVGKSKSVGIEFTGTYAPIALKGFTLQTSITYQDPRYVDFNVFNVSTGSVTSLKDKKPLRQANFMTNTTLNYENNGVDLSINWSYTGSRYADDANLFQLDAFHVVSAGIGYTFKFMQAQSLRLGVHVYNLFDSLGLTEGDPRLSTGVDPTQFPYLNARPILPRRVTFDLTYNL